MTILVPQKCSPYSLDGFEDFAACKESPYSFDQLPQKFDISALPYRFESASTETFPEPRKHKLALPLFELPNQGFRIMVLPRKFFTGWPHGLQLTDIYGTKHGQITLEGTGPLVGKQTMPTFAIDHYWHVTTRKPVKIDGRTVGETSDHLFDVSVGVEVVPQIVASQYTYKSTMDTDDFFDDLRAVASDSQDAALDELQENLPEEPDSDNLVQESQEFFDSVVTTDFGQAVIIFGATLVAGIFNGLEDIEVGDYYSQQRSDKTEVIHLVNADMTLHLVKSGRSDGGWGKTGRFAMFEEWGTDVSLIETLAFGSHFNKPQLYTGFGLAPHLSLATIYFPNPKKFAYPGYVDVSLYGSFTYSNNLRSGSKNGQFSTMSLGTQETIAPLVGAQVTFFNF